MSCYINIAPINSFEAKRVPSVKASHSPSFNTLVSWLLTTTITILGSNHTEPTGSTYPADVPPNHSSSDLVLGASSPLAYQLLPTWLTSSRDTLCIDEL